jgi:hypothetical protein
LNIGKVLSILNDSNINKEEVFALVDTIKKINLDDESNLRNVIRQASKVAKRPISPALEDELVKKIQKEGITANLLDYL